MSAGLTELKGREQRLVGKLEKMDTEFRRAKDELEKEISAVRKKISAAERDARRRQAKKGERTLGKIGAELASKGIDMSKVDPSVAAKIEELLRGAEHPKPEGSLASAAEPGGNAESGAGDEQMTGSGSEPPLGGGADGTGSGLRDGQQETAKAPKSAGSAKKPSFLERAGLRS